MYTERAQLLLGSEKMERISKARVCVVGLGGVGSWCAEALVRTGVGSVLLIDEDVVSETNINRQLCALHSTVGMDKAELTAKRMGDISPHCDVRAMSMRYEASSRETLFEWSPDYIADCIDLVSCKLDLIETALTRRVPILSALGTGNKYDATKLEVSDISATCGCSFARVIRRELRRRGIDKHKVVYSTEESAKVESDEAPPPGRRSVPGSLVWVPATAGLLMAQEIIADL